MKNLNCNEILQNHSFHQVNKIICRAEPRGDGSGGLSFYCTGPIVWGTVGMDQAVPSLAPGPSWASRRGNAVIVRSNPYRPDLCGRGTLWSFSRYSRFEPGESNRARSSVPLDQQINRFLHDKK